jgi:uncharacterized protein (DUF302 family)
MTGTVEGLEQVESKHSVDETVRRVLSCLGEKGIKLFALVDHSGEAAKAGLTLRSTKLLTFGSPKGGTPLMQSAPTAAIDLPLKALIWQDDLGKTWIAWNTPEYLQRRHGFSAELIKNIAGVSALLCKAAE